MNDCSKVKNSCKICLQPVSKKNGLQCRGNCRKWYHYECLNYSPGKIQDVKSGIITVNCPCPHCVTILPKEALKNPPFTCDNPTCPANVPPQCEAEECPVKLNSSPPVPVAPGPMNMGPPGMKLEMSPTSSSSSGQVPPCYPKVPCGNTSSDTSATSLPPYAVKKTVVGPKKTKSCSCASKDGGDKKFPKTSSEGNMLPSDSLYVTVQDMCKTVGQLSTQLKQLMCKMMDSSPTA